MAVLHVNPPAGTAVRPGWVSRRAPNSVIPLVQRLAPDRFNAQAIVHFSQSIFEKPIGLETVETLLSDFPRPKLDLLNIALTTLDALEKPDFRFRQGSIEDVLKFCKILNVKYFTFDILNSENSLRKHFIELLEQAIPPLLP